jgi:hypothetical protein
MTGTKDPMSRRRTAALLTVCGLLLAAAVGLNASVMALKLSFRKEAVPLRAPVTSVPGTVGPWVQVSLDERFSEEIEDELATREYLRRVYVDTRKADAEVLARWNAAQVKSAELREELQRSVVSRDPLAVVVLHVAYYTGAVDTVPHIPDRCMVAGGFDPVGRREAMLDLGERELRCSFVQFQERSQGAPVTLSVAYLFQVNGDYEYDAITGVRKRLQDLRERHAYFAKIELMTQDRGGKADASLAAMSDFLSHALPEIEKVLPDWNAVRGQAAGA